MLRTIIDQSFNSRRVGLTAAAVLFAFFGAVGLTGCQSKPQIATDRPSVDTAGYQPNVVSGLGNLYRPTTADQAGDQRFARTGQKADDQVVYQTGDRENFDDELLGIELDRTARYSAAWTTSFDESNPVWRPKCVSSQERELEAFWDDIYERNGLERRR